MNSHEVSAAKAIGEYIDQQIAEHGEPITEYDDPRQGSSKAFTPNITQQILDAVDLDIAHSPVLPHGTFWPRQCTPTQDGKWMIYDWQSWPGCGAKHAWGLDTETIKLYRARFLVMRDAIWETVITENYRLFPELSHYPTKARVLPAYGITWVPGGGLKEALAEHYKKTGGHVVSVTGTVIVEAVPA